MLMNPPWQIHEKTANGFIAKKFEAGKCSELARVYCLRQKISSKF